LTPAGKFSSNGGANVAKNATKKRGVESVHRLRGHGRCFAAATVAVAVAVTAVAGAGRVVRQRFRQAVPAVHFSVRARRSELDVVRTAKRLDEGVAQAAAQLANGKVVTHADARPRPQQHGVEEHDDLSVTARLQAFGDSNCRRELEGVAGKLLRFLAADASRWCIYRG
jgi:hypothetical protein